MDKVTFKLSPKASISLTSIVGRAERRLRAAPAARAAGGSASLAAAAPPEETRTAVLIEARDPEHVANLLADSAEAVEDLGGGFVSAEVGPRAAQRLAPVVAGALALMLQRDPALTTERARTILAESARHDGHTGLAPWTTGYGYGKLDVGVALAPVA
jgi:subtilisin family serine protease